MAQILVVDDEPAVRGALVAHLESMGHSCVQATQGLEALELLHLREFDAIVTDVAMPRMNGLQFLERALPHLDQRIPVVLLSSVDDLRAVSAAVAAGAFDYLPKPASIDEVRRVIEACITRRAEVIRLHGRRRAPGGPIPRSALGEQLRDHVEAPLRQAPAGVPAFRTVASAVTILSPEESGVRAAPERSSGMLHWVCRMLGRGAA